MPALYAKLGTHAADLVQSTQMRVAGFLVLLALAPACKAKNDADAAPDPAALKAQQDLVARRDKLLAARQKLQSERDTVDEQIKTTQANGGDTTELVKHRSDLDKQMEEHDSQLIEALSSKVDTIVATGDAAANITAREATIGNREGRMADRERTLAAREANLADRERQLAQREKDTCSAGPPVIMQAPPPKGASYTRRDIEPLLREARATMASKGLLPSDLGAGANLESETTKAMAEGDWGRAFFAASQLDGTVKSLKIDRTFVQGKYNRLHARVQGAKQDEATMKQLTDGMTDVMQKFGDGDLAAANKKLNVLWSVVK
jgi:hypothetical protein